MVLNERELGILEYALCFSLECGDGELAKACGLGDYTDAEVAALYARVVEKRALLRGNK